MSTAVQVELSKRSQELIDRYLSLCLPHKNSVRQLNSPVDCKQLISWLSTEIIIPGDQAVESDQEIEFILASLRAELLGDLLDSMGRDKSFNTNDEENPSWSAKLKFVFLALAGTLLAGCEGFDSITTMLSILSLPSFIILLAGLSFSILSIVVFYGFDLVQVSKNLGVTLSDAPKLLDVYLLQMKEIKRLRKKIESYKLAELSIEELERLENTVTMLQIRFQALAESSAQFDRALNGNKMRIAKLFFSIMAGLLFFGSGFFAGQSVAMFVAALIIPTVLPTFWPVVIFSIIIGLAAFALYWNVEYEGLKKLVSGWFGLDEDKVSQLCDDSYLDEEKHKLERLKDKVISTAKLVKNFNILQSKQNGIDENEGIPQNVLPDQDQKIKTSTNPYSFHSVVRSVTLLNRQDSLDVDDCLNVQCG